MKSPLSISTELRLSLARTKRASSGWPGQRLGQAVVLGGGEAAAEQLLGGGVEYFDLALRRQEDHSQVDGVDDALVQLLLFAGGAALGGDQVLQLQLRALHLDQVVLERGAGADARFGLLAAQQHHEVDAAGGDGQAQQKDQEGEDLLHRLERVELARADGLLEEQPRGGAQGLADLQAQLPAVDDDPAARFGAGQRQDAVEILRPAGARLALQRSQDVQVGLQRR